MFDFSKFNSREDIVKIIKPNAVALELGVAEGKFSEKLLAKSDIKILYSIDSWAGDRGHDDLQYAKALERLSKFGDRSKIIRANFADALSQFEDNFFDLIYIDGYAHTGQEEGQTIYQWFSKLKRGGVYAGDDYSDNWPKVKFWVDKFAAENNLKLNIINDWNSHRTWVVFRV
jgi:predicted O-methyltransferase YrrM